MADSFEEGAVSELAAFDDADQLLRAGRNGITQQSIEDGLFPQTIIGGPTVPFHLKGDAKEIVVGDHTIHDGDSVVVRERIKGVNPDTGIVELVDPDGEILASIGASKARSRSEEGGDRLVPAGNARDASVVAVMAGVQATRYALEHPDQSAAAA
ncbi:MAG: hypothetical protein AAB971_00020 [Patescibacteria group bacterium]